MTAQWGKEKLCVQAKENEELIHYFPISRQMFSHFPGKQGLTILLFGKTNTITTNGPSPPTLSPGLLLLSMSSYGISLWSVQFSCAGYVLSQPFALPQPTGLCEGQLERNPQFCASIVQQQPKHFCYQTGLATVAKAQHSTGCSEFNFILARSGAIFFSCSILLAACLGSTLSDTSRYPLTIPFYPFLTPEILSTLSKAPYFTCSWEPRTGHNTTLSAAQGTISLLYHKGPLVAHAQVGVHPGPQDPFLPSCFLPT